MERASLKVSHCLGTAARRRFQPPLPFARALLNSVAPVFKGSLRSVTAELHGYAPAHWWRSFAPRRISSLSSSQVCEEEGGKERFGFLRPMRPAAGAEAGRKGRR